MIDFRELYEKIFSFDKSDVDKTYPIRVSKWFHCIQINAGVEIMVGNKKRRFNISVLAVASAITVLAAILGMMMFMQFQLRKDQAVTLFVEKGSTLIQSFEAGFRGRPEMDDDSFYLQKLLMEVAQQPDIDYLVVTDEKGQIMADSDPSMLGGPYGLDLNLHQIAGSRNIRWRQVANQEGAGTFEVYRGFFQGDNKGSSKRWIVFLGFNMDKIEKASREDAYRMAVAAGILVLIGSLAIASLFLAQAYRLSQSSLSRITVFSEALVKNLPFGLLAVDQTGRIVACNDQAKALLEDPCDEATGKEASVVVLRPFFHILERVRGQAELIEEEVILSGAGRTDQIWEVVVSDFSDEDVHKGKILLARNITTIRQMEREVARSRRLNAIASLAAGVAHEIRNPLSSIRGLAVYFKSRLAGNKDDEETADVMIAETERLNRVISQLIDFARPPALKIVTVHPGDLVRHTVRLVDKNAEKNRVVIEVRADDRLPQVEIDPDRIKQVLLNIFLNALAAMPNGGRLLVELTSHHALLKVTISDSGEGIKKEDLPRITDPYYTSKPSGTGLGLAIVQKILDAHGGSVHIESQEGVGTKVTLQFPVSAYERMKNEESI